MSIRLRPPPDFHLVRHEPHANNVVADSTTISLSQFPIATYGFPSAGINKILVHWSGDSGMTAGDNIDIQLYVYNMETEHDNWVLADSASGLVYDTIGAVLNTYQAGVCFIRVDAVSFSGTPKGLHIWAAKLLNVGAD